MNISITLPDSCNFSDYLKLNYYPEDILNYFGYQLITEELVLPKSQQQVDGVENLKKRQEKQVKQDLNLYRVPNDLEELMTILVAIITGVKEENE